jgi:hypothetical protein
VDLYPGNEDRPRDWSPAQYYREWEYYYARIMEAVPTIEEKRLQAGAYCWSSPHALGNSRERLDERVPRSSFDRLAVCGCVAATISSRTT